MGEPIVYVGDIHEDFVLDTDCEDRVAILVEIGYPTPEDYGYVYHLRDTEGDLLAVYAGEGGTPWLTDRLDCLMEKGRVMFE